MKFGQIALWVETHSARGSKYRTVRENTGKKRRDFE